MHHLSSDPSNAAVLGALLIFYSFLFLFAIIGYVIFSFFLMKVFDKAGVQGKWRAWVPIYNWMVFCKLGDLSPWWVLILYGASVVLFWIPVIGQLFPIAAFVYTVLAAWRVGLKLQKEPVWLILYVFLSIVWFGINAFDKSRWNPAIAPAPWAGNFLADKTAWAGVPAQPSAIGGPAGGTAGGYQQPPQGYQQPPQGYQQPPAASPPPAASEPPAASPPPAAPEPPAVPEPPADPAAPRS